MAENKMWSGAFVCIFDKSFSKILLLNRKNNKEWEDKGGWGNIGGSVEPGETPLHACVREAEEEIGVSLKPEELTLIHVKKTEGPTPYTIHFYATCIDETTKITLNNESHQYRWFPLSSLPEKMLDDKNDILKWGQMAKSGHGQ